MKIKLKNDIKTIKELFHEGWLVHIFAGKNGELVCPNKGESIEDTIVRAAKISENGDVWLTPHW